MKRKAKKAIRSAWDIIILLSAILTIFTTLPDPAMAVEVMPLGASWFSPIMAGAYSALILNPPASAAIPSQEVAEEITALAQGPAR